MANLNKVNEEKMEEILDEILQENVSVETFQEVAARSLETAEYDKVNQLLLQHYNKKVGYNSLSGGNSLFEVSDDIRKIRSENAKGTNNPMYGKPGTWLGKNFSDTHKENISKSLKGKNKEYLLGGKNHLR